MKLYRGVKASERLPEETNYYNTDNGSGLFDERYFISDDEHYKDTWRENDELVWLEPIEVTEDDIEKIIEGFAVFELPNTHNRYNRIAKVILSKLKNG